VRLWRVVQRARQNEAVRAAYEDMARRYDGPTFQSLPEYVRVCTCKRCWQASAAAKRGAVPVQTLRCCVNAEGRCVLSGAS